MDQRTRLSILLGFLAVLVLAIVIGVESLTAGAIVGVLGCLVVLSIGWWSGRRGRHIAWAEASAQIALGRALVLWKPGCVYCERLLLSLGRDPRVTWVNVWQDEQANARVRELNGGDELTPTVIIGDEVLRNPTADEIRALL